jgi:hypothetical protein
MNTPMIARAKIQDLEDVILAKPQVDLPVKHHFAQGVYGREMLIPAGVVLTGKIHATSTINILAQGTLLVISSDGTEAEVSAPYVYVSPPNVKKAGYAVTDCVFINVHGTHETDLDKIEEEVITNDYLSIEGD